jgi:tetratricopeptide (TPR) repeat protein
MDTPEANRDNGIRYFDQRDYEAAMRAFEAARVGYEAAGQDDLAHEMLVNMGLVHRGLGENQQAIELMQTALRFFQAQQDTMRTAQVLGNMGSVYLALNDKEQAELAYRQAADAFRDLGEDRFYGETLLAMGDLKVRDGKLMDGASLYRVGLELLGDNLTSRQKVLKRISNLALRMGG